MRASIIGPEYIVDRIGNDNLVRKSCEICAAVFHVRKYRAATARFCSQKCGGSWHATTRLARVPKPYMRNNQLRKGLAPSNKGKPGLKGRDSPSWKERIERVCEHCGDTFSRVPWVERQNGPSRFCCRECFQTSGVFIGENSPCWVGGPETYRGRGWPSARARVIKDQAGHCAECQVHVGPSLAVHHIRPFRLFATAADANVRTNLVGLCQSCHMKAEAALSERYIRRIEAAQLQLDMFVSQPKAAVQEALL